MPLRASFQTEPAIVGFCGPTCLLLEIAGTGVATHQGLTVIAGPSQVDLATGGQTGTSTLTGANGDAIVIAFSGLAVPSGPAPTDLVSFEGTWEAISGTGRFDGVVGEGTYSGEAAGTSGTLRLGRISNPGQP